MTPRDAALRHAGVDHLKNEGNRVRTLVSIRFIAVLLVMLSPSLHALERMDERLEPCAACHGEQGRSQTEAYYPSIAGKPAHYLFNQLQHFRDGRREHRVMAGLLAPLSDDYLWHMARYYAQQSPRVAPASQALAPQRMAAAQRLVEQGDEAAQLPACVDCHGQDLHGVLPAIPGLTGLDAEYITAQLGAWREGVRRADEPDCMGEIARRMSAQQITEVAQWLASRPASSHDRPAPANDHELPLRCFAQSSDEPATRMPESADEQLQHGAYLVRAGNCAGCHTAQGGAPLSGGRAIDTPFGAVYSSNLTADRKTGLGEWSADEFWHALTQGVSRDGRLLYPAFPYTHYSMLTRADSDAMWSYLRSVPAVTQAPPPHQLRFPFNTQLALRVWRWLYFDAQPYSEDPSQDAAWNRGRYLVEGLGHCSACHGSRNALGGLRPTRAFAGSLLPDRAWYAPPLARSRDAEQRADLAAVLKHGSAAHRVASGPMAQVVKDSLQHLSDADIQAMVSYLDSLPEVAPTTVQSLAVSAPLKSRQMTQGAQLYEQHCADCHGSDGQGEALVFPALRGNDAVLSATPGNAIRSLKFGGYPPSTQGRPYPFGMPPFAHQLSAEHMAAVLTYVRNAWGNEASAVSPVEVAR